MRKVSIHLCFFKDIYSEPLPLPLCLEAGEFLVALEKISRALLKRCEALASQQKNG